MLEYTVGGGEACDACTVVVGAQEHRSMVMGGRASLLLPHICVLVTHNCHHGRAALPNGCHTRSCTRSSPVVCCAVPLLDCLLPCAFDEMLCLILQHFFVMPDAFATQAEVEARAAKAAAVAFGAAAVPMDTGAGAEEEEEEDPLDAFMAQEVCT